MREGNCVFRYCGQDIGRVKEWKTSENRNIPESNSFLQASEQEVVIS